MRLLARALSLALLASLPYGGASGATHLGGAGADREGTCARGISWKMTAQPDGGRIEIKAELDTRRAEQRWTWVLKHNGSFSDRGTSWTIGTDGSFEVERMTVDVSGTDVFRLRATRKAAVCVARVIL